MLIDRQGNDGLLIEDTVATNGQSAKRFKKKYLSDLNAVVKGGSINRCFFNKISNNSTKYDKDEIISVYADGSGGFDYIRKSRQNSNSFLDLLILKKY